MESWERIKLLFKGAGYVFVNVDCSFSIFREAGYDNLQIVMWPLLLSSLLILLSSWGNKESLEALSARKFARPFILARKLISRLAGRFGYRLVSGIVYAVLAGLVLIPYVPALKETGLLLGQIVGLRRILAVVLFVNAARIISVGGTFLFF